MNNNEKHREEVELVRGEFAAEPFYRSDEGRDDICFSFDREKEVCKPTVLLHSCCGPCSTSVIDRLVSDYDVIVYFFNPNIDDTDEYLKRKNTQEEFILRYNKINNANVQFIQGSYDPDDFYTCVEGLEDEPEGGMRCPVCFELRLRATADKALEMGIKLFGTTLTVSPHKNYRIISAIGQEIAKEKNLEFLDLDFKKKAGFQKSIEMSREYELYRQNFCGCSFAREIADQNRSGANKNKSAKDEKKQNLKGNLRMRNRLVIPKNYNPILDQIETQRAIKKIKDYFQQELAYGLQLRRVSAPLFVQPETGLNDNLNGTERRVTFSLKGMGEAEVEIVQSLAKWKRMALGKYRIPVGKGIYTDMNAIRRDEDLDNLHSVYVDQWDWEKVITKEDRSEEYLRETVNTIYNSIKNLGDYVNRLYRNIRTTLPNEIFFITSQELEDMYPDLSPEERENQIVKQHGAVFIRGIGGRLKSGEKHDGRSPDYDDWNLNGDIILWNDVLDMAFEISSMGIRVDEVAMERQLEESGNLERKKCSFHKAVLAGELPYSIGGGIGQSRLCMYFLRKAHIGEVQASVWPEDMVRECRENGIFLL